MIEFTESVIPSKGETSRAAKKAWKKTPNGRADKARYAARKRMRDYETRPFVGWDGEGVTREDGSHDYVLLANSRGDRLTSLSSLGTEEIFAFLMQHHDDDALHVIYGASYDWNMWLADIERETLERLYKDGTADWHGYRITWRRGKTFTLRHDDYGYALWYDVVSFFQRPFVAACDEYLGDDFVDRDMIVENKMLRSSFRAADMETIIRYNDAELVNLVNLMTELRKRLVSANLRPSRWDGPGAIAVALFQRENVKDHLGTSPEFVLEATQHAYFGGRFEVIKYGHVERKAYEYDVNSAYPWALCDVPSLTGGSWHSVPYDGHRPDFGLYRVTYSGQSSPTLPQPLPFRNDNGTVCYPQHASGWYWGPEVAAAQDYCERFGGTLEIREVLAFQPATDSRPFGFVPALYAARKKLKAAGDGAHVGIKLGLNSMYGKLAQQVGWRDTRRDGLVLPPYHQLEWAGYVTARCRAAVLGAAMQNLESVIAFETDAVFTDSKLPVVIGSDLGQWEYSEFQNLTYLQSGTYFADDDKGNPIDKTRGVDRGNLTRERVLEAMRAHREDVPASLTRFTGLGLALAQDFAKWRRWITSPKNVSMKPDGKRVHMSCPIDGVSDMGEWHTTIPRYVAPGDFSAKFPLEWKDDHMPQLAELRQGHYESWRYDDA